MIYGNESTDNDCFGFEASSEMVVEYEWQGYEISSVVSVSFSVGTPLQTTPSSKTFADSGKCPIAVANKSGPNMVLIVVG